MMAALPADVTYRCATEADLPRIMELEHAGFPADEAASPENMTLRIRQAQPLFRVRERNGVVDAYVCSTLTAGDTLTHESMSTHDPAGATVCIHSVVVDKSQLRRGIATRSLREYVASLRELGFTHYRLLCKEQLQPLYAAAGFSLVGPSKVVHGADQWFEMALTVPALQ